MYKQAIIDISALFKQDLVEIQTFADTHPDDPLLEVDTHDINHGDYEQFTIDKITFVDVSIPELSFTTWLPLVWKNDFENEQAFPKTQDGKYQAQSISVMKNHGLVVGGINRWFRVVPPSWAEVKYLLPDDFILKGQDAFSFWQAYWQEIITSRAEIAILAIRRNPELLSHFREEEPYLLDHPGIQYELVEAFRQKRITEPKSTRGQKHQITQNIFELYHFVYFYRFQGMTLEDACAQAVDIHKYLVPDDWSSPDETLKKRITRLDKYPRISLNATFKEKNQKNRQKNQSSRP